MDARRVAALAAVGSVIAWGLKAVAIGVAGGLDQSPLEGPLWALGMILLLVAFTAAGVAMAGDRGMPLRVVGGIAGVVLGLLVFLVLEEAIGGMVPESAGWVKEEAGLWVISAVTAIVLVVWWRRSDKAVTP